MNNLSQAEIIRLEKFLARCWRQEISEVAHDYTKEGVKRILETVKKIEEACKTELGEVHET